MEKDLGSIPTTQLLALWIWTKSPVSCVLLGLFLDKSTECLGLSRDKDKSQSSCLFRCCPQGNRGQLPMVSSASLPGGSLNESFLPAVAHKQAAAHLPLPAQGYPTQPLGRLPRLQELTEDSWEKDPAGMAYRERLGPGNPGPLAWL